MGNIHLCFKKRHVCIICQKQITEYYIVCAICKQTMHDDCEYTFNRENHSDYCAGCRRESRMYYKFDAS